MKILRLQDHIRILLADNGGTWVLGLWSWVFGLRLRVYESELVDSKTKDRRPKAQSYVLLDPGISNLVPFSAEALPVRIATADVIAFSPPQRTGLPVRMAEQNSAISF
jgi:hypothetical protein